MDCLRCLTISIVIFGEPCASRASIFLKEEHTPHQERSKREAMANCMSATSSCSLVICDRTPGSSSISSCCVNSAFRSRVYQYSYKRGIMRVDDGVSNGEAPTSCSNAMACIAVCRSATCWSISSTCLSNLVMASNTCASRWS